MRTGMRRRIRVAVVTLAALVPLIAAVALSASAPMSAVPPIAGDADKVRIFKTG